MKPLEKIAVVLRNPNSTMSMNRIEVYDNVGATLLGVFTLKGGESRTINIFQNERGQGSVKIRNANLQPPRWAGVDAINPGDVISA